MANRVSELRKSGRHFPYPLPAPSSSPISTCDGGDIYITYQPVASGNAPGQSAISQRTSKAFTYFKLPQNSIRLLVEEMQKHSVSDQFECGGRIFLRTSPTQFIEKFAASDELDVLLSQITNKSIALPCKHLMDPKTQQKVVVQANKPFLWYGGKYPCVYQIYMNRALPKLELLLRLERDYANKYGPCVSIRDLSTMIDGKRSPTLIRYFNMKLDCCYSWLDSTRQLKPVLNFTWILPEGGDELNMALLNDRAVFMKALLAHFAALRDGRETWVEQILSRTITMSPFTGSNFTFSLVKQTSWLHTPSNTPGIIVKVVRNLSVVPSGSTMPWVLAGIPPPYIEDKEMR